MPQQSLLTSGSQADAAKDCAGRPKWINRNKDNMILTEKELTIEKVLMDYSFLLFYHQAKRLPREFKDR
jgi:hypothetical protein